MTRRRSPKGAPADDLAARVEALEAAIIAMGEALAEVSALFAAVTEQAGTAVTSLADQQASQAAVIERLALDAGLIDQPTTTYQ